MEFKYLAYLLASNDFGSRYGAGVGVGVGVGGQEREERREGDGWMSREKGEERRERAGEFFGVVSSFHCLRYLFVTLLHTSITLSHPHRPFLLSSLSSLSPTLTLTY